MTTTATPIHYRIRPSRPEAHIFEVDLTVREPNPDGQRFSLPAWIPGSYMIREFARNIVTIRARCGDNLVALEKIDKHTWQAAPCAGPITLSYVVYAWDLSVRGAHVDTTHAFFNGTSVFLAAQGQEASPCVVTIERPSGSAYRNWRIATSLPIAGAKRHGFGKYRAENYDELIDHPVEMGTFALITFRARGVPHDIAITGRHDADLERLARDLKRICEHQIDLFGGKAPMQRYVFLVMAVGDGYGGLEHRASTALLCSRWDLPRANTETQDDRYLTFLGLASHEYFHTWNVKRIKPAAFTPYDLTQENYTRLLWAFEGITSYYDDLTLVRCGLMTEVQYLKALARTMTTVQRGSGRLKQTVAESSFDAWVKYYRQDENAPNAVVSYYAKGALIALALDLTIRKATAAKRSLDDVMQALWNEYGRTGRGVGEDEIETLAQRVTGVSLRRFFDRMLRSTSDIDWAPLLRSVGVGFRIDPATSNADRGSVGSVPRPRNAASRAVLGARVDPGNGEARLGQVFDDGPAQKAGLSAGDVLIAIDGIRCTASNWELLLGRHRPGDAIRVTGFRRDELFEYEVVLQAPPADTFVLWLEAPCRPPQRRARSQWLCG
jgi:predicted metalloprotease with PDZ domain